MLNKEDEEQETPENEDSKGDDTPEGEILEEEKDSSIKSKHTAKNVECEECGKKFHARDNLKRHKVVHSGEKPYTCEICGESFPYWTSAKRHKWVHHENTSCKVCGQDFPTQGEMKNHIEVHGEDWPIKCEICGKKCMRTDLLQNHIKTHGNGNCRVCGQDFPSGVELKNHIEVHGEDWPIKCELCGKKFMRTVLLQNHIRIVHNGKTFKCEKCNKSFSSEETFSSHKLGQCEEQLLKCDNCEKRFSERRYLQAHEKRRKCYKVENEIEFPVKPTQTFYEFITEMRNKLDDNHNLRSNMSFYCEMCRKAFSSATDLERHQKSHLKQKALHKCEECGKSFRAAIRLKRHSRVHRGQNLYECDICKTKFQYKSTLSTHKLDHDKELGIQCNLCGKYLVRKVNLARHLKLFHSDKSFKENKNDNIEKNISPPKTKRTIDSSFKNNKNENTEKSISSPKIGKTIFNCEVCMKSFNRDRYLKRHSRTHNGETPFKCRICLSEFKFQSSLTKHQVFSHSHNGLDGTWQCSFCNKDFVTEKRLKQHMRMHTEIKLTNEVKAVFQHENPDLILQTEIEHDKPAIQDQNPPPAHSPMNPQEITDIKVKEHLSSNENTPSVPDFVESEIHNEGLSINADIPSHNSEADDCNSDADGASSDSCSGQSSVSDEQNFVESVQTSAQSVISGVRVYFEDGVYCQVSADELNNLDLNQLNSSPRVVLSSLEPVLQGSSRVLVAVQVVFKDSDSGEVMAVRPADV